MGFIPNPNLLGDLERTAEMQAVVHHAAERIAETARSIAPVGDPSEDDHPGQFQESIHAERDMVIADDPAAVFIIFGTRFTPPHDTLLRAAEMEGLRVLSR